MEYEKEIKQLEEQLSIVDERILTLLKDKNDLQDTINVLLTA